MASGIMPALVRQAADDVSTNKMVDCILSAADPTHEHTPAAEEDDAEEEDVAEEDVACEGAEKDAIQIRGCIYLPGAAEEDVAGDAVDQGYGEGQRKHKRRGTWVGGITPKVDPSRLPDIQGIRLERHGTSLRYQGWYPGAAPVVSHSKSFGPTSGRQDTGIPTCEYIWWLVYNTSQSKRNQAEITGKQ